ncbi:MAG: lysophospholipid acyltransferase family protein [Mycobacteriaceae bacterium]
MELVYGTIIRTALVLWKLQGLKMTTSGEENLPVEGGAVIAINHTGYMDFTYAGLPLFKVNKHRKLRYMAKKEVFDNPVSGPLMRACQHIAVDRGNGNASYNEAVAKLKKGELVAVYPEATISRSFEIKDLKSGAARMAIEANVPIVPHIVWGAQRVWTKGHPKNMVRPGVPIVILVGEPIEPTLPAAELTALLRSRMQELLIKAQELYGDHPAGEYWVPKRLGGGAPSLEEATALDEKELAERAAKRLAE